jgi:DNA-binding Xre family transcriptional regulator
LALINAKVNKLSYCINTDTIYLIKITDFSQRFMIKESHGKIYRTVAYNLYTLRMSKKLTQQALSDISEVERAKISRIENYSEDFLYSTILNLATALEVGPEKILDLNVVVPDTFEADKKKIPKKKSNN